MTITTESSRWNLRPEGFELHTAGGYGVSFTFTLVGIRERAVLRLGGNESDFNQERWGIEVLAFNLCLVGDLRRRISSNRTYSDLFPVGLLLFPFYYMLLPAAFHLYHCTHLVSSFLRGSLARTSLPDRPLTGGGAFIAFDYDIFFD